MASDDRQFSIIVVGIILPFESSGTKVGLVSLPWNYSPWLIATLFAYCSLSQIIKQWYIKKSNRWL